MGTRSSCHRGFPPRGYAEPDSRAVATRGLPMAMGGVMMCGMMKYRMIALDIDGTLYDSTGRPPEANLAAIRRARGQGVMVVLCTGRGLKESRSAVEAMGYQGPMVLANGALVSDPTTGKTLHRAVMEPHLAMPVIEYLMKGDDAVLVLLDPEQVSDDYLVIRPERLTSNTRWWFEHVGATWRGVSEVVEADLHHALRVGIVGPGSHMPGVMKGVVERFGAAVFVQHFMAVAESEAAAAGGGGEAVHVLEVFTEGVNKWSGLMWLAEEHGIAASEIAAIGDHVNDVEMVGGAGCGIAMDNAVAEVKAVARRVTEDNNAAGVATAIDRLLAGIW